MLTWLRVFLDLAGVLWSGKVARTLWNCLRAARFCHVR